LFTEAEMRPMGIWIMFNRDKWEEITSHLEKGEYEIALKKAEKNLENFPNDLIAFLLLLQAQHRVGVFKACEKTYLASQKNCLCTTA